MILEVGSFNNICCSPTSSKPEAVQIKNNEGVLIELFFKNNPFKLSLLDSGQSICLYCIVCGEKRFTDEQWKKVIGVLGKPSTICGKSSCSEKFEALYR